MPTGTTSQAHTPAHWNAIKCKIVKLDNDNDNVEIATAWVNGRRGEDDVSRAEANARLIAAAPELLEACKDIVQVIDHPCIQKTLAAIAKAEGRS